MRKAAKLRRGEVRKIQKVAEQLGVEDLALRPPKQYLQDLQEFPAERGCRSRSTLVTELVGVLGVRLNSPLRKVVADCGANMSFRNNGATMR